MKKYLLLCACLLAVCSFVNLSVSGQIAERGSSTNATSTTASLTITKPTGVVAGDVLIANIAQRNNGTTAPSLSGWTLISSGAIDGGTTLGAVLYKVAGASEPANYAFTLGSGANNNDGSIVAFSGVDATGGFLVGGGAGGPFDVAPGSLSVSGANGSTATATGITTATANAAVIMLAQSNDNQSMGSWTTTSPGTLTELYEDQYNPSGSNDLTVGAAWAIKATAGATGNGTMTLGNSIRWGAMLIALRPLVVDAGPDRLIGTASVNLAGTTTAGSPTYLWTKTSGPAGETIVTPANASTSVTGLVQGTYVFRLTVNSSVYDEVTIRVITGTNLWATSSDGTQVSSFTVASGTYTSGPTNVFAPTTAPGSSTAALGRTDKPGQTSGYFYWLPNDGSNGVVNIYGASAAGNNQTLVGSLDLNGGSNNTLDYVRLGMGGDGTGWLLARENTTNNLYLAKFTPNGVNPVTVTIEDPSVTLVGGTNSTFVNGDLCLSSNNTLFVLANNGSGVTQIFTGAPNGASTTLTKKWDLVDGSNNPFTGTVNGAAFDVLGAMYISTAAGLYYINPATINGPAGTVQCTQTWAGSGLQDLASNFFPNTILLPVKLGSFGVARNGNDALVKWVTVSEINCSHFEIERSYDGINFVTAGTKQAAGNSASDINYDYADPITVASGNIYYRLKTVDIDGKASYSKIVSLKLDGGSIKRFTAYPNPFTTSLKLELNADQNEVVKLRISNAAGQIVLNRNITVQKGDNVIVLTSEIASLKPGIHIVEITTGSGKLTEKIIKR